MRNLIYQKSCDLAQKPKLSTEVMELFSGSPGICDQKAGGFGKQQTNQE